MNQGFLQFLLRLAIFVVRTGQVKNVLRILIWTLKTKASYDEAMARLDGSYYDKQVQDATDKFKADHPEDFEAKVHIEGYDKFLEATKK